MDGMDRMESNESNESPANPFGALMGLRVIDLTRVLGGPYCTQILADHGADVIKVEPPTGDETRGWGPPFKDGLSAYFSGTNRNKRFLALDLGRDAGREVLLRLLEDADVLVHNFKAGTLERWGLGWEAVLSERFPRLVYCHITGFGEDGPMGGLPGYDAVLQAVTGAMSINGTAEGEALRIGTPIVDLGTGMTATIAILMAIIERQRSGRGQKLDISLYDASIAMLHPHAANTLMTGKPPRRSGNAHPNIAPYDQFPTRTVPIFLAIGNNRQFAKLCAFLGRPDLPEDARFADNGSRLAHRDTLRTELLTLLAGHDAEVLTEQLLAAGVPAGAVREIPDVLAHPHTRHRAMVVEKNGYRGTGIPIKLSRTPGHVERPPAPLGSDGRDILQNLGYREADIVALQEAGVLVVEKSGKPDR